MSLNFLQTKEPRAADADVHCRGLCSAMAQLHAEQVFAYFYDVSGAHGDQKITGEMFSSR